MIAVGTLLLILFASLIITRVATVALQRTGLSLATARFQSRSAFTGVGFTTSESEQVVGHPVRRQIVMWLMLFGNVGLVSVMSTVVLSFVNQGQTTTWVRWAILVGGMFLLWVAANSRWVDGWLGALISRALTRWTDLDTRDYAHLLHLGQGYGVTEITILVGGMLADVKLGDSELRSMGLLVLGIKHQDGSYVGAPDPGVVFQAGDKVFLYGRHEEVSSFCEGRAEHNTST